MNRYIIVYPNTSPNYPGEICRSGFVISGESKEEVNNYAMTETPDGFPYLIIEADLYDDTFHDVYQAEFDNPDGYGTNQKLLKSFKDIGFLEWTKK